MLDEKTFYANYCKTDEILVNFCAKYVFRLFVLYFRDLNNAKIARCNFHNDQQISWYATWFRRKFVSLR